MWKQLIAVAALSFGLSAAFAQSFDVASIKPAAPMEPGRIMVGVNGGPGTPDPGQMTFTNVSLSSLIQTAYDVRGYQVSGPAWLDSARFDIAAKVPAGATKEQSRLMLQNLLAERFKLMLHHSTKDESIYALVVAKNGPKLKESPDDPNAAPDRRRGGVSMMIAPGGRMHVVGNGATIGNLIGALALQLDRPIVDMTGLAGKYDIVLDFAPDPAVMQAKMAAMGVPSPAPDGRGPSVSTEDPNGAATIFSALPEQLGLRLEARKGPVDLLVIDSIQKTPTEN